MITRKMVRYGYDKGFIKLIVSPNDDGVACQIGNNWFYFGGYTAEVYDTVEAYTADIPLDTILSDIFCALEAFREYGENFREYGEKDEYLYYDFYLREWGVTDSAADSHAYILEAHPIEGTDDVHYVKAEQNESIYEMLILFESGEEKFFYLDGRKPDDENFEYTVLGQI